MSRKTLNLNDRLYEYLLSVSLREPEILRELREKTSTLPAARMQISPEQGQFMALLVRLIQARKTLEIGVFTGYSSLAVALALPSDGQIIACDVSTEWTTIAQSYWQKAGVQEKITLHLAPAEKTLNTLIQQKAKEKEDFQAFDFVFIDADKENYSLYYEKSLTLVRPGGLILIDNTLWSGDVADETIQDASTQAIRNFNQKLYEDKRIFLSLLPLGDGLTLAFKQ